MDTRIFEIIAHSLGVDLITARASKRKRDKKLPVVFYRNRFLTNADHTPDITPLRAAVETGLMSCVQPVGDRARCTVWWVTIPGIALFRQQFAAEVQGREIPLSYRDLAAAHLSTMVRDDVVPYYISLIADKEDNRAAVRKLNQLIMSRWSVPGLVYIKEKAWGYLS